MDFAKLCFVRVSTLSMIWNSGSGIEAKIENMLVRTHGFTAMTQWMWGHVASACDCIVIKFLLVRTHACAEDAKRCRGFYVSYCMQQHARTDLC